MTFEGPEQHIPEEIPEIPQEESFFDVGNLDKKGRDELRALLDEIRNKA